ncbi:hypothetical protein, partial [Campylobacter sp. MIT 97-5078]
MTQEQFDEIYKDLESLNTLKLNHNDFLHYFYQHTSRYYKANDEQEKANILCDMTILYIKNFDNSKEAFTKLLKNKELKQDNHPPEFYFNHMLLNANEDYAFAHESLSKDFLKNSFLCMQSLGFNPYEKLKENIQERNVKARAIEYMQSPDRINNLEKQKMRVDQFYESLKKRNNFSLEFNTTNTKKGLDNEFRNRGISSNRTKGFDERRTTDDLEHDEFIKVNSFSIRREYGSTNLMGAKNITEPSQIYRYASSPTSDRNRDRKESRSEEISRRSGARTETSQTRTETSQTLSRGDRQLTRLSYVQTSLTKAELERFKGLFNFINLVIKQGKNQQEQDKNLA